LLGSALLTLFLLWGYTYAAHQNELDRKLHRLAENISTQFTSEVGLVLSELERVDAQLKGEVGPHKKAQAPKQGTPLVCYSRTSILDPPTESQKSKPSLRDDSYPFFNAFIWMNSGGDQQVLWTIGRKLANLHNVKERPYFRDIVNGHFLSLTDEKTKEEKHFVLQSVASRATGQKTVVISIASDFEKRWLEANPPSKAAKKAAAKSESQEPEPAEANGVVAMDTNLMSVMRPVMPEGFGYRIIDERGTVLFQSAESKDWAEDFFEECDNNPVLRSFVSERLDGDLDINYAGRGHHLYVQPLKNFPNWTLIVFRNKQPLRALYLEIVTLAAFLFFGYALTLFLIFCIVYVVRVNSRARAEWIWPAPSFTTVYSEFMLVNVFWSLLIVAELVFLDGLWLVLLVFLTSLLGIANLVFRPKFAILRKFVERLNLPERLDYSHAYTLNMVMVLIIAGMLPALAFFKVTYNKGMRLFTLQEQRSIWKSYEERNDRITSRYSTIREKGSPGPFRNETLATTFIAHRTDETRDIYEDFYETSHRKVDPTPDENAGRVCLPTSNSSGGPSTLRVVRTGSGLENLRLGIRGRTEGLLRQLPFFNAFVESDIIAPSHAADCSWVGESWMDPSKGLMHTLKIPGKSSGKSLLIDTKLRTFQSLPSSPTLDFILALLAFLSIPISLFFLSRFAVRRIFLLDLDRRSLAPIPQNAFVTTSQNLFVIVSSPLIEKDSPPCNGDFYPIDLKKDAPTEGWAAALEAKLKSEELPKKFVLDHFDCHIGDLDRSLQKLELVEQLLAAGKIVVIMSNVDPSAYSAPELFKGKEQNDEAKALEFADRWANVAARFLRVYLVESGNVKFFQETLSQRETSLITAARSETQRDKVGALIELVREECSPRGCLQKIGLEIVKQPEFENMASVEIFKQIAGQARLYYQRIWASCTEGEKLTLVHLAEDRFLSRSDPQLALLLRKGLIVKAPDLRLMNQTFKHFILTRCSHEGLASIEEEAKKTSTWHSLRIPLLTGFVGVILFLVITQKDFYSSSLTIITGLTTGIPALFKVLSLLKTEGGGQNILSSAANQLTK
jgi:hypothetical protein